MPNNRIFWAVKAVAIAPYGSTSYVAVKGAQSCGITTTFNLEQVFELGQLSIYENIENIPDIEVTIEKFLDGNLCYGTWLLAVIHLVIYRVDKTKDVWLL